MGWARVAFGLGLGLGLACQSGGDAFECTSNEQCGADGTCQSTGFCSFPDTTCPSEQRYGSLAGDRLADTCVPEAGSTSSDSSTTSAAMTDGAGTVTTAPDSTAAGTSASSTSGAASSSEDSTSRTSTGGTGNPEPSGPVVWYRFEQVDGRIVEDASGNGIDGSCVACGDVVAGAVGSGLEFSTLDNIVLADHDPALESGEFTVSAWISLYSQDCMSIVSKPLAIGDQNSWQLYTCPNMMGNMDLVGLISVGDGGYFVTTYDAADGEFLHVAMTFTGEVVRLYVDGEQRLSMQFDHQMVYDDSSLLVGGEDNALGLDFPFQGVIDEVRIYARALTEDEIAGLFAGD